MKTIKEANVVGNKVLVRSDLNCPLDEKGNILNDYRIERALLTINYLVSEGAKVIVMTHLGHPEGEVVEKLRLDNIASSLSKKLGFPVSKANDCIGEEVKEKVDSLQGREVLLLENLRFHKEERENNEEFSKKLASLADIYANDAFGTSHRAHASMVGVPQYIPAYAGLLVEKEVDTLNKVLKNPEKPLVAIFGGVKVKTKLPVVEKFLGIADSILVGGKIANNIEIEDKKLLIAQNSVDGFDIGEKTIKSFKEEIKKANTIIWNGPLGYFEKEKYQKGTREIAEAVANSKAFKVAGGGETLQAIFEFGQSQSFDFLSTGGGSMLKFLGQESLVALKPYYHRD